MIKPLSVKEVRRVAGTQKKQEKSVHWHTAMLTVKQVLPLHEYIDLIKRVIEACKLPDGSIACGLLDFSIRVGIISSYSFIELPEDIEELYDTVYASDLYDTVCAVANKDQIKSIYDAVAMEVRM